MSGSFAHNETLEMESFFDKMWVRINKALRLQTRLVPVLQFASSSMRSAAASTPVPSKPPPAMDPHSEFIRSIDQTQHRRTFYR
ncbi:hypothetical protein TRAPUB_7400 [Trametes pubescens]|uniref:Uncharacterized protein n=1 Tax=Trametes pubescens TaxID=154538 RepID=A0A1M2V3H6_TRAPU|nr:hypothetical protein TRAPUB_7400 [Trametes pubescens]